MGITTSSRELYQPSIDEHGNFVGGERDYQGRLDIIESVVDFTGKRVLDLGCSGGFFSFSIARKAKHVTAVDADSHMIQKNIENAKKLKIENIDFVNKKIDAEFLNGLENYDVVLFLSVFHHIIIGSSTYDWTEDNEQDEAMVLLDAVKNVGDVLVFEIGRPEEGYKWCADLKRAIGGPRKWVTKHVFGKDTFEDVSILPGVASQRWLFRTFPLLGRLALGNRVGRKISRLAGVDRRDFREIYIGKKARSS